MKVSDLLANIGPRPYDKEISLITNSHIEKFLFQPTRQVFPPCTYKMVHLKEREHIILTKWEELF